MVKAKAIFFLEKPNEEKIKRALDLGVDSVFISHRFLSEDIVRNSHDYNLKVFVEIGIFVGEELWQKYPDCRPVDRKGKLMGKASWYAGVCPSNPSVRREKLELIRKIVHDFMVDGVWLDFTRYPCHWEEVRGEWFDWKCRQITDFVSQIRRLIDKKTKRKILLGMFCVPWQEDEFDGAIRKIIGQDFKELSKNIDVFTPMTYHNMVGRDISWIGQTVRYFRDITQKPILPIIQTEDKPSKISQTEFEKQLVESLKDPAEGTIVFFLEDLLKDPDKIAVVRSFLK